MKRFKKLIKTNPQRILLLFSLAIFVISCVKQSQESDSEQIREAVSRMMSLHPQSTLQDIYKSCFQDAFGPGHLINDTVAARNYLIQEINENDYIDTVLIEPTGIEGNYVRVNLALVKQGYISDNDLLNALIASAANAAHPSCEQWQNKWHCIMAEIEKMNLDLPDFKSDSAMIEQLLSDGKYVMHHSDLYGETYHPHYRIIDRQLYEALITE